MSSKSGATPPQFKGEISSVEKDLLVMLHKSHDTNLKFLAQRSFKTTIQAVTLNLIIVGALPELSFPTNARPVATAIVIIFNLLVFFYLVAKGKTYYQLKTHLKIIEAKVISQCSLLRDEPDLKSNEVAYWKRLLWDGTAIFCAVVAASCMCSLNAIWR